MGYDYNTGQYVEDAPTPAGPSAIDQWLDEQAAAAQDRATQEQARPYEGGGRDRGPVQQLPRNVGDMGGAGVLAPVRQPPPNFMAPVAQPYTPPPPPKPELPGPTSGTPLRDHAAALRDRSGSGPNGALTPAEFDENRNALHLPPVSSEGTNEPWPPNAGPQQEPQESMDDLKKRLGFSWGSNVPINSDTGRPATSTVVRDPITHAPVQAREAEGHPGGGSAVSYPAGNDDDAYFRYRANQSEDPLALAGLRNKAREWQIEADRLKYGPIVEETSGEKLKGKEEIDRILGIQPQVEAEHHAALASIAAHRDVLRAWKKGYPPQGQSGPLSDDEYKYYADKLDNQERQAEEEYRVRTAASAPHSIAGIIPR